MNEKLQEYLAKRGYSAPVVAGGLDRLLVNWEQAVMRVVEGYSWLFEEYLNDLDGRRILGEALDFVSKQACSAARDRVERADILFLENSVELDECVWGQAVEAQYGYSRVSDWFYYRKPRFVSSSGGWP